MSGADSLEKRDYYGSSDSAAPAVYFGHYLKSVFRLMQSQGKFPEITGRALDVGTGSEKGAGILRGLGVQEVYGIDLPEQRKRLDKAVEHGLLDKDRAVECDVRNAPQRFGTESFDVVASFCVALNDIVSCKYYDNKPPKIFTDLSIADGNYINPFEPYSVNSPQPKFPIARPPIKTLEEMLFPMAELLKPKGVFLLTLYTDYEVELAKSGMPLSVKGDFHRIPHTQEGVYEKFVFSGRKVSD